MAREIFDVAASEGLRRVPVHSTEAEEIVLGGMILSRAAVPEVLGLLSADDFYNPRHATLFSLMRGLHTAGADVNTTTLLDALERHGEEPDAVWLAALMDGVVSKTQTVDAARVVLAKAQRRKIAKLGLDLVHKAYNPAEDMEQVIGWAVRTIESSGGSLDSSEEGVSTCMEGRVNEFERPFESKVRERIITPWNAVNQIISHIEPGEQLVIAARPSNCKSLAATQLARQAAIQGVSSAMISLEMPRVQVVDRMLCDVSGVASWKFRSGEFDDDDLRRIRAARDILSGLPMRIWDDPFITPDRLQGLVSLWVRKYGLRLLVLDYLQLVKNPKASREREVAEVSSLMKRLAVKYGLATVVLSQVNREVERRSSQRLGMADLRESGAIEQDADIILFIQPFEISNECDKIPLTMTVGKSRSSATGDAKGLIFNKKSLRIEG